MQIVQVHVTGDYIPYSGKLQRKLGVVMYQISTSFPWNLAAKRNFAVLQCINRKGYMSSAKHGRTGTNTSAETNTRFRCAGHLPFSDDTEKIETLEKLKVIK